MNADGTGKVFDGLWCLGYVEGRLYNFPWGRSGWAIGGWAGGASEKEEIGVFSRWGGGAALIREPINATILRQSIIIFPICIATELLFKSAPPVSTPLATPCKSCPGRQRDSSSGTPYRFCYAVGFFFRPGHSRSISLPGMSRGITWGRSPNREAAYVPFRTRYVHFFFFFQRNPEF